jgi:ferredoxin
MHSVRILLCIATVCSAFCPSSRRKLPTTAQQQSMLYMSTDDAATTTTTIIELSLPTPLGLILEEVQEGAARGVYVQEVSRDGSAFACKQANQLVGCTLVQVNGLDVTTATFDQVMNVLVNAPSDANVQLQFQPPLAVTVETFEVGATVAIQVIVEGEAIQEIQARVGDNLRTVLLEKNIEVYQGIKQKLGNCGGAGQCGFCAFDFVDSLGWLERSDYEDKKLAKFPNARLACLNTIDGPCTIQKTKR